MATSVQTLNHNAKTVIGEPVSGDVRTPTGTAASYVGFCLLPISDAAAILQAR